MTDEIAIRVENVYKNFVLPHEKTSSVKSLFTGLMKDTKRIKEMQHALKNISFEVKKGEFFGVVGRNGSGKSTMLKILAGIYQPTQGKVYTQGKLVPFIELGVGFNPELTGRENVFLNGAMLGFSEKEITAMYDDIVEFAELERFMDQKLKNYSSGMQVRLAFSMATRAQADILLVDEVLAVGDADFQRKCFDYFKTLKRDKRTVIFVSHDMEAIRQYCDRALLIEKSHVLESGNPEQIAASYTKLFIHDYRDEKAVPDKSRKWGDGKADISSATIKSSGGDVTLSFIVEAKEDLEGSVYGFSLKDAQGVRILGTNSKLSRSPDLTLASGKHRRISYTFQNVFNDGDYTVDIAILGDDGVSVRCWCEDAARITIKKPQRLPSILNYPIRTDQEEVA